MISRSVDALIESFTGLPGIGTRTAQRLALYMLAHNRSLGQQLAKTLATAMEFVRECAQCRNFTEETLCPICQDPSREKRLCIVELPVDVFAVERSGGYKGRYFVLHGKLSPMDGIGPQQLSLDRLSGLIRAHAYEEVVLATNPTVEGEVTAHYIGRLLEPLGITITRIAHGVPMGGELDYVDGGTLSRAFTDRKTYETEAK